MTLLHPLYLVLFLPLFVYIILNRGKTLSPTLLFSNASKLRTIAHRRTFFLSHFTWFSRVIAMCLVIIALSRPQVVLKEREVLSKGIDMMIAVDVSGSMAAEDFKPDNRLAVAKSTIKTFVSKRNSDRIGLVIFGGDAYTQCPQTLDYDVLLELLHAVQLNDAGQGTAIGMAISTALNRIKNSVSESKVIILLTDGENNRGVISPSHAASLAKDLGVKIYTIGIGKEGGAPIPYIHPVYGKIYSNEHTYLDEQTLKQIASITNGKYYRAVDPSTFNQILSEINDLETTKIKSIEYASYTELFPIFIGLSIFILFLEMILSNLFIIKIP